jgi:hypothetical protein
MLAMYIISYEQVTIGCVPNQSVPYRVWDVAGECKNGHPRIGIPNIWINKVHSSTFTQVYSTGEQIELSIAQFL